MSWLQCKYDPLGNEDPPDLCFPFSPNAPLEEQVANLVFRFSEYKKIHQHISACLATVSSDHYQVCDTLTLVKLKQPIQVFLFARESLQQIEDALEKDINFCNNFLKRKQEQEQNGSVKIPT